MSVFISKIRPTVSSESKLETYALGTSGQSWLSDKETGKVVKLAAADNFVLAADGDDIEGIVRTVEEGTVNSGFHYGAVQTNERAYAVSVGAIAVRDPVVAAAQAALGTENNANRYPKVKAGAPALITWRVVSIVSGGGADGSVVVIERV